MVVRLSGGGGNSSSSGGHIIEDESGTEMEQRSGLQFKGVRVSDDETNDATVVDSTNETIEWSLWNAMASSEQDDYVAAHPNLTILNAPGVDGSINANIMTKLWENSDPTVAFTSTNISLASSDYDALLWVFRTYISTIREISIICTKGSGTYISIDEDAPNNKRVTRNRIITRNSDTSFGINNCNSQIEGNDKYVTNDSLVPVIVYGIKKSISIDVSAVISDVSTSASKCMLTDGITSVQSALNGKDITVTAGDNVSYCKGTTFKIGSLVIINYYWIGTVANNTEAVLKVSAAPSSTIWGTGNIRTAAGQVSPCPYQITSNGNITQQYNTTLTGQSVGQIIMMYTV